MAEKTPYKKFALVYDSIMGDRFYNGYFKFLIKIFNELKFKPANILEIACGTGKLAKIFLDKEYEIEGLDMSGDMLDIAGKKGLKIHRQNMVSFKLKKKYDLILCIFDSLNYIQRKVDLKRSFNSVNKHLESGGLFIFDMNSPFGINKVIPKNFKTIYRKNANLELIWLNSHRPDTWIIEMIMFEKRNGGIYKRFYEKHIEKAYKLAEIKKMLKKSSFKLLSAYSNFKFDKVKKDSGRWFFVCEKDRNFYV